jgi:hypothetical protein
VVAEYTEDCCFNYPRDHCKGAGCPCGCHAEIPERPGCGHEAELDRLNRLVDTLSRALARYQDEELEVGGDDPTDHPYQRRGSWSHDDWCAVEGCTSKASAHQ